MSDPNDTWLKEDKGLEEYLRRESVVSQRYRELDADDVPPQLDAAVLARARAAVSTPDKRKPSWMTSWVKWGAPVALAASAVMVVAIVLEVGVQDQVRMPAPQVEQATTSAAPTPESRAVRDVIQEAPPVAPGMVPPQEAQRERKADVSRAPAPPSTEREAAESVIVTGARPPQAEPMNSPISVEAISDQDLEEIAAPTPPPDTAAPSSVPETVQLTSSGFELQRRSEKVAGVPAAQVPRLEPEPWLERIRALRREGKVIEADQQWREFLESYPQFEVSETDSARPKP